MSKPHLPVVLLVVPTLLGCPHSHAGHMHHHAARAFTSPAPSQGGAKAAVPTGGPGAHASSPEVSAACACERATSTR